MKQALITLLTFFVFLCSCNNRNSNYTHVLTPSKVDTNNASQKVAGQKDSLISMLQSMKAYTLDCTADIYWKIIQRGKASIPFLIESLTDTTITNIYDDCKQGKLNIGEVSYFALEEIAEIPVFEITQIQFDLIENGCWSFYYYLFDNRNKKQYQELLRNFFIANRFVFVKYDKKELNECYKLYKIDGKLKWKK